MRSVKDQPVVPAVLLAAAMVLCAFLMRGTSPADTAVADATTTTAAPTTSPRPVGATEGPGAIPGAWQVVPAEPDGAALSVIAVHDAVQRSAQAALPEGFLLASDAEGGWWGWSPDGRVVRLQR